MIDMMNDHWECDFLKDMFSYLIYCMKFTAEVSTLHTCDDCVKVKKCEYAPDSFYQAKRYNCPLWKGVYDE